ncbi:MAG: hypothetical protein PHX78_08350 [bacterium]|nr:hypothetical protein [bacterium]
MKNINSPRILMFLFIFPLIAVPNIKAAEKQKLAVVIIKKDIQPVNIKIKCERKNDDMGKCLSCHEKNGWKDMKFVHGPLAINDCRPCHIKPDKEVLKKAEVDFRKNPCNFCHQDSEIKNAHPETLKKEKLNCLTCHNPHASDKEYFLR